MFNWIKDNPIIFILIFLAIVAPSFFFGAMRVVFYIVLGIVILLFILSLVFRARIAQMQSEMQDRMNQQQGSNNNSQWGGFYNRTSQSNSKQTEEGDVKIFKQKGASEKKISKEVGDYVEFEEIEEK